MDLFDYMRANTMEKESPLASRMRPTTLDEVVGQKHIIGKDRHLKSFAGICHSRCVKVRSENNDFSVLSCISL